MTYALPPHQFYRRPSPSCRVKFMCILNAVWYSSDAGTIPLFPISIHPTRWNHFILERPSYVCLAEYRNPREQVQFPLPPTHSALINSSSSQRRQIYKFTRNSIRKFNTQGFSDSWIWRSDVHAFYLRLEKTFPWKKSGLAFKEDFLVATCDPQVVKLLYMYVLYVKITYKTDMEKARLL